MTKCPREEGLDHTLDFLREGYQYIPNRKESFASDMFETKLLGERAIILSGEETAKLYYDNDKMKRADAAPKRVLKTLFGETGVQTLDGEEHHHRKQMFMDLMSPEGLHSMNDIIAEEWDKKVEKWTKRKKVNLYKESKDVLTRAACRWAGVPLEEEDDVEEIRDQIALLFETPASVGLQYWRGKSARKSLEKWMSELIEQVRAGKLEVPKDGALYHFSQHKDLEGKPLQTQTTAVEVLNIIRPIVAISIWVAFIGHALITHNDEKEKLAGSDEEALERFSQEVRRFYPFFPANVARVKKAFEYKGCPFEKDTLVVQDLYGTNHDARSWTNPSVFNPSRFQEEEITDFNFIPQGGGSFHEGHRCPGDWLTLGVMKTTADFLANKIEFDVPEQDLSYSLVEMPSIPSSEIILTNIRRKL